LEHQVKCTGCFAAQKKNELILFAHALEFLIVLDGQVGKSQE
jgi:hypothetical protein